MKVKNQNCLMSVVNRNIFRYEALLLWYNVEYILLSVYLLFWLYAPVIVCAFMTSRQAMNILGLPLLSLFYFNIKLLSSSHISDRWYDTIDKKRNEATYDVEFEKRFKYLLKMNKNNELDCFEKRELINQLKERYAEEFENIN